MDNNPAQQQKLGASLIILSAVLFGLMPLLAKIAYAHGSNAYTPVSYTHLVVPASPITDKSTVANS